MLPHGEISRILTVVGLCLALFVAGLGVRPLWNRDEGLHAATSKDMVQTGDWITPTVNGEPFFDKPAFHNWLVALSFLVFGFTEFAARLPNAIMGLATVLVVYLFGTRQFGSQAGFVSAVVLATSGEFFVLSRTVMHDMSLTFFVTLGLALFFVGHSRGESGAHWIHGSYVAFGCAVLAKGPAGLILPGAIILLYLITRRNIGFLARMSLGKGVLIGLAVAAPWYLLISLRNPDYARYFFVELNLGSFLSEESHHPESPSYYFFALIIGFVPWSLFLPLALARAWRRKVDDHGQTTFLLLWATVYFVFFSLAVSKLSTYILPMYPALALMVGCLWCELFKETDSKSPLVRAAAWSLFPVAVVPTALVYLLTQFDTHEIAIKYGIEIGLAAIPLLGPIVLLEASAAMLHAGRPRLGFGGIVFAQVAFLAALFWLVVPEMNRYQTSKLPARVMDRMVPPGEDLLVFGKLRDTALFYSDRHIVVIRSSSVVAELLASSKPQWLLIGREEYDRLGVDAHIVMETGDDLLISNQIPSTPGAKGL